MKRISLLVLALTAALSVHADEQSPPTIQSVECSLREDQCYILTTAGDQFYLDRQVLPYIVAFDESADDADCQFELCYGERGQVTGLNPRHEFYRP